MDDKNIKTEQNKPLEINEVSKKLRKQRLSEALRQNLRRRKSPNKEQHESKNTNT